MREQQTSADGVHLLSVGPFGNAVAEYLRRFRNDVTETTVTDESSVRLEIARITAVAAWRPVPKLCERLNELSFQWQRPFVPLIVESAALRLGPLVIPGRGACWRCWEQRSKQHSEWLLAQSALSQHYSANPDVGPQGYLAPFAMMAATRIAEAIEDLDSSSAVAGYVWQIDMISRAITTGVVVGVHDCPRCGLHRRTSELSFAEMERDLGYLWAQARAGEP